MLSHADFARIRVAAQQGLGQVATKAGVLKLSYGRDERGRYAVAGFSLPEGFYAELPDLAGEGHHDTLIGIRVYY